MVAGGVALLLVLLGGALLVLGGGDSSTPRAAAEDFARAFNDNDVDGLIETTCGPLRKGLEEELRNRSSDGAEPGLKDWEWSVSAVDKQQTTATAEFQVKRSQDEPAEPIRIDMRKRDSGWKLCQTSGPGPGYGG